MRSLRVGWSLLLVLGLGCLGPAGNAWAGEPATAERPVSRTLAEMVEFMKPYKGDFRKLSMDEKRAFIPQIVAAFETSAGVDGKSLKLEDMKPLLTCAQYMLASDLGDPPAQAVACQRMTLAGLAHIEQLPHHQAQLLLGHLQLNDGKNLNAQGKPVEGVEWQELRLQLLRHRLRLYTRIDQLIDPAWDPKIIPKSPVMFNSIGPGATPDDPEEVVRQQRLLAASRQMDLYYKQERARRDLESYGKSLSHNLPYMYKLQPVTRADIEQLEIELRAAIGDERLRNELLELSLCQSEAIVERAADAVPLVPAINGYEVYRAELAEIRKLCAAGEEKKVAECLEKLQEKLQTTRHLPRVYVNAAHGAVNCVAYSPLQKSTSIAARVGSLGLAALQATEPVDLADVDLLSGRLFLTQYSMSRSDMTPERVAELALDTWNHFSASQQKYGPFDSRLPLEQQPPLPAPPTGYADWFSVGQSPAARADAELFPRYLEWFAQRTEHMRNSGRARELSELREKFYPQLKKLLRGVYSGSPEREQAGAEAIAKRIAAVPAREELIDSLSAASLLRDRLDMLDHMHDESGIAAIHHHATPPKGAPPLTVPAPAGAIVVRGHVQGGSVKLVAELAKVFAKENPDAQIHVAGDNFASYARLCDRGQPYHAVISTGELTMHELRQRELRNVGDDLWSPETFLLGQRRMLLVVNKANPIAAMKFAYIARAFGPDGPAIRWQDVGGKGNEALRAYGEAAESWTSSYLLQRCLFRMRETQSGAYSKQQLAYRKDLVECKTAKQVIERVGGDLNGIGFLAWNDELTPADFAGVKLVSIAQYEETAVPPPLDKYLVRNYPLAQMVYLYAVPDAPMQLRAFGKFAESPAGMAISQKFGVERRSPPRPEEERGEFPAE